MTEGTMTPAAFAYAMIDAHGAIEQLTAEELADELVSAGLIGLIDGDGDDMTDVAALEAVNEQFAAFADPDLEELEELPLARAREVGRAYLRFVPAEGVDVEEWDVCAAPHASGGVRVEVSAMASTGALRAFVREHAALFRSARHEERRAEIVEELEELADEEIAIRWDAADWIDMADAEIIADALRRGRELGEVEGFEATISALLDRAGEDGACVDEDDLRGAVLALLDGFADGDDEGEQERAAGRVVQAVRLAAAGLVARPGLAFEWLLGLPQEPSDEEALVRRGGSVYVLTEAVEDLPKGTRIEYDDAGPWATVLVPTESR